MAVPLLPTPSTDWRRVSLWIKRAVAAVALVGFWASMLLLAAGVPARPVVIGALVLAAAAALALGLVYGWRRWRLGLPQLTAALSTAFRAGGAWSRAGAAASARAVRGTAHHAGGAARATTRATGRAAGGAAHVASHVASLGYRRAGRGMAKLGRVSAHTARRTRDAASARLRAERVAKLRRHALELNYAASDERRRGSTQRAVAYSERALAIFRALGDRRAEALALNNLGLALADAGDGDRARASYEAAAEILGELDEPQAEGTVFANLGALHRKQDDEQKAGECWQKALERLAEGSPERERIAERLPTPG